MRRLSLLALLLESFEICRDLSLRVLRTDTWQSFWCWIQTLLDDFEVRGRDHSQRPHKPQSVNIDDIAIRIIIVSPDNGTAKKVLYKNYKLFHDFQTVTSLRESCNQIYQIQPKVWRKQEGSRSRWKWEWIKLMALWTKEIAYFCMFNLIVLNFNPNMMLPCHHHASLKGENC